MSLFDSLANLFQGQSPTTALQNGETISWNAPQDSFLAPIANAVRPISRGLENFNQILQNTDPQQAQPIGQKKGGFLQTLANSMSSGPSESAALRDLADLAGKNPQYFASQYGGALGNYANPDSQINSQIKQEQLRAYQDPLSNPETKLNYQLKQQELDLARAKQQSELDRQAKLQQIMGGGLAGYTTTPTGINPAAQGELNRQFSQPLSVRNNNPLNMRPVGATQGFEKYGTPQAGIDAATRDLTAKITGQSPAMAARYGQNYTPNLANLITTWAPPSENDTQNYIDTVSKKTGIDPNQVLTTSDISKLLPAMAQMEGGKGALASFGLQGAQPMAQPTQQPTAQLEQTPQYLKQLEMMSQVDPEKYAGTYLAQLGDYQQAQQDKQTKAREAETKGQQAAIEGEVTLRKEFEGLPDVKQFRDVEGAYKRIQKANTESTGASDIALIFNYMKMLDPSSTVREGEFATAQNSGGIPAMVQATYNQAVDGQRLTPEQRNNFLSQATAQYQGADELFTERANQYKDIAKQYGYKPERVIQGARGKASVKPDDKVKADPALMEFMTSEERALFQ